MRRSQLAVQRAVVRRHGIGRRALEHGERTRLLGDDRNQLHRRGAGADHRDIAAGEVHRLVRPGRRVQHAAFEDRQAFERRRVGRRQRADRHDHEARAPRAAVGAAHVPAARAFVEVHLLDARVQLDVAPQVEAVGHVVGVAQQLGLRRIALAPVPLLLQRLVERIRVLQALDVDARAGIAVGVPRAADAGRSLEHTHLQALAAQLVQPVQAAEARADDQHIKGIGRRARGRAGMRSLR